MKALRPTDIKRLHRGERRAVPPEHRLTFLLQSVEYAVNVGSIFRIADACWVDELILAGITPTPPNASLTKVARGKEQSVPWRYVDQADAEIPALKERGYRVCAIELTDAAQPYYDVEYPERICFVVGHEDHGVTRKTLALCDAAVYVPMYGKGASLNVHVALAVVGFHVRAYRHVRAGAKSGEQLHSLPDSAEPG